MGENALRNSDCVISSRIRLARNVAGEKFPAAMDAEAASRIMYRASGILSDFELLRVQDITTIKRQVFVERHLASRDLMQQENGALLLSKDGAATVMLNEEDHIRIQSFAPGLDIESAYARADRIDDRLSSINYAFSGQFGYLTSCPTNVGTGMRASVMMHLPALTMTGMVGSTLTAAAKFGLAVRGIYGEGSDALGGIYQISNQTTLGMSEAEIVESLLALTNSIIERERRVRDILYNNIEVEDRIYRSLGILKNVRRIDYKEFVGLASDINLGVSTGKLTGITNGEIYAAITDLQPGCLQMRAESGLTPHERDVYRAKLVREIFAGVK